MANPLEILKPTTDAEISKGIPTTLHQEEPSGSPTFPHTTDLESEGGINVDRIPSSDLFGFKGHGIHPSISSQPPLVEGDTASPIEIHSDKPEYRGSLKPKNADDRAAQQKPETESVSPENTPEISSSTQEELAESQTPKSEKDNTPTETEESTTDSLTDQSERSVAEIPEITKANSNDTQEDNKPFVSGPVAAVNLALLASFLQEINDNFDVLGLIYNLSTQGIRPDSFTWDADEEVAKIKEDFGLNQLKKLQSDAEIQAAEEGPIIAATTQTIAALIPSPGSGIKIAKSAKKMGKLAWGLTNKQLAKKAKRNSLERLGITPENYIYGEKSKKWWIGLILPHKEILKGKRGQGAKAGMLREEFDQSLDSHHLVKKEFFKNIDGMEDMLPAIVASRIEHQGTIHTTKGLDGFMRTDKRSKIVLAKLKAGKVLSLADQRVIIGAHKRFYKSLFPGQSGEIIVEAITDFEINIFNKIARLQ